MSCHENINCFHEMSPTEEEITWESTRFLGINTFFGIAFFSFLGLPIVLFFGIAKDFKNCHYMQCTFSVLFIHRDERIIRKIWSRDPQLGTCDQTGRDGRRAGEIMHFTAFSKMMFFQGNNCATWPKGLRVKRLGVMRLYQTKVWWDQSTKIYIRRTRSEPLVFRRC